MSPVTSDARTVEMPNLARMTNSPARVVAAPRRAGTPHLVGARPVARSSLCATASAHEGRQEALKKIHVLARRRYELELLEERLLA